MMRILIISAQKAKIRHYQEFFRAWEIDSDAVNNSSDALRLFNESLAVGTPYKLVMTDYILSGEMTGLGLARILSDVYLDARILIFPSAELFDQDVLQEYNQIRDNMVDADLSSHGLREIITRLRSGRELSETKYSPVISKPSGLQ